MSKLKGVVVGVVLLFVVGFVFTSVFKDSKFFSILFPDTQLAQVAGTVIPPALPQVYVDTTMPIQTGQTITVNAGGNLQTALNSALPGDTIVLQAGATFTGNFTLPAKSNPNNKWIVIESSDKSSLPPQGTRVAISQTTNMPKIVSPNSDSAISTAPATKGWRFVGIEITVAPAYTGLNYGIVYFGTSGTSQDTLAEMPSNLIVDRSYVHGQATTDTTRCLAFNSAYTAVVDSLVADCHANGYDSQAIIGWNGSGPFKIENNLLEGAGENIMFGGADPSIPNLVASDIVIRNNYVHKPLTWNVGDSSYAGTPWTIKNLLELKSATRVLMEGNVFDGSWAHAQTGWALAMWSANQAGGCLSCGTTDITIQRNLIRNAGGGINLGGAWSSNTLPARFLITENVLDPIAVGVYAINADNRGFQMSASKDVEITRNVLAGNHAAALIFADASSACSFRDNVWQAGTYGVLSLYGAGGFGSAGLTSGCGTNYSWSSNTLVGSSGGYTYPAGTTWVSSESQASLAAQIRTIVSSATAGAISGNWSGTPPPPPPPTPSPTISLSASPTSIISGQSSTLSWSSTNSTSCIATGGWTGTKATSGAQGVSPAADTSYILTCTGSGGSATESSTITVSTIIPPPPAPSAPTVNISANPTSISSGGYSTLSWSSTNATSCSSYWSTSTGTSGSANVSPTATTTYSIICTGAGGSATDSTTVTVATVVTPPSQTPFAVGDYVEVTASKLNIRSSPGGSRLGSQSLGAKGTVTSGPTTISGVRWWNINFLTGVDGFAVETYLKKSTAPTPPTIGSTVHTTERLNVRSLPSTTAAKLGVQGTNSQGTVLAGPVTASGYTWWQVDFLSGADGWVVNSLR